MSQPKTPEPEPLHVVEVPAGQRDAYQPLLQLADDSPTEIASYRERGQLFGLLGADGEPRGQVLAIPTGQPHEIQLMSVAIAEAHQGQGLGRALLEQVLDRLEQRGWRCVLVSTATAGLDVLRLYMRLGFRMLRIERDYFGPANGYPPDLMENGIPIRDQVWLDRPLGPGTTSR